MFKLRLQFDPMISIAGNTVQNGVYIPVGTATRNPARILIVENYSDAKCYFSTNSVDDHFYILNGESITFDFTTNQTFGQGAFLAADTQFYVKGDGAAGTTGRVNAREASAKFAGPHRVVRGLDAMLCRGVVQP